jgi:methylphosphotriester-DNA--protein-cysteine methyltransferase
MSAHCITCSIGMSIGQLQPLPLSLAEGDILVVPGVVDSAQFWLFHQYIGISVREYHEQLRLAVAQQRLQQGYGLEKAALTAGFSSSRQLRRAQLRWH